MKADGEGFGQEMKDEIWSRARDRFVEHDTAFRIAVVEAKRWALAKNKAQRDIRRMDVVLDALCNQDWQSPAVKAFIAELDAEDDADDADLAAWANEMEGESGRESGGD
jgi:hypothetical protein